MITAASFAAVLLILISCSDDLDPQFCDCLEATGNVDDILSSFIGGGISDEEWKEVKELSNTMAASYKDYTMISIEEELKLKEQCECH